jgi:phenylpyruvate tautomerase PptA (4-oxalocrotonate tautomerase family)
MPQLDAYIPAGALTPAAERDLIEKVTDLLIRHEGADPTKRDGPLDRMGLPAPAGERVCRGQGAHSRDPMRVWVFTLEVPEGAWGGGGRVVGLADIAGLALGDADAGREYAERVFAERRGEPVGAAT